MKKIFNISIIISLFIFAGCKKILDENPKGLVSTNNFYNTIDEATAGLIGTYSFLQPIYDAPSLIFASEMATDILTVPSSYNADRIWISYDKFDFNASDAFIFGTYRAAYQLIGSSNTLIASLKNKKLPGDSTKKPIIEGEAHFLRALTYFNLVRWFGGVPLVTIPLKDIPSAYVSRATEDEVYALILSDLNFAVNNLKETSEGVGRANKLAALTLLGKVQLTRKSYTDALNTLKLVVGKRSLYPKYGDVFKLNNENNIVESIFEVQYGISPENNQIVQYSLPVDISGHGFVYGIFAVPTTFINSFETADSTRLSIC